MVFKLLETLEYRWIDVLPRLLAADPAERPTNLSALVETLRRARRARPTEISVPAESLHKVASSETPRRKSRVVLALAGAAILIAAIAGYFAFSRRSASSATDDDAISPSSVSSATNDFDAAFSPRGIYEEPRQ